MITTYHSLDEAREACLPPPIRKAFWHLHAGPGHYPHQNPLTTQLVSFLQYFK